MQTNLQINSNKIVACILVLGTSCGMHAETDIPANRRGRSNRNEAARDRFQFSGRLSVHARS